MVELPAAPSLTTRCLRAAARWAARILQPTTMSDLAHLVGACLVVVACFSFVPTDVWARAGGGGGFGGGGGGGGSGGGGSGGDGGLIYLLVWLCVKHPLIGIPTTIAVVAFMIYGGKSAREGHVTRTIRRGQALQERSAKDAAIAAVRARDPAFNPHEFLDRVRTAFVKIQHAWSDQDLSTVRPFISDGILERFSLQVGMQKAEGYRNLMQDVTIHAADIAAAYSDDSFDTFHVRIRASAVDTNVDLESGRRLSGSNRAEEFVEIWSFHRRPGAKTLSQPGAIEGNCPRCAAPLDVVDVAKCNSCGAQVNSGEFDWVLAEITQEMEWHVPSADAHVPGLAELRSRDPHFSVQHIEDRVSVMFWRMRAAEFYRKLDQVRPVLSDKYANTISVELQQMEARGEFWKEPAVGKVELIDVQPASPGEQDLVRVKVRWSGTYSEGDPACRSRELRRKAIYTHVFILARDHDAKSVQDGAFHSAGCPSCGAPINVNKDGDCSFCGATITDGRWDWVLADVQPFTPDLAFRAMSRVSPTATAHEHVDPFERDGDAELSLAILARVMFADGEISPPEREALVRLGSHRGLNEQQVQLIIDSAHTTQAVVPTTKTSRTAVQQLEQLVHAVLADGQISRRERKLLSRYAERVDLSVADVKMAISRERRTAYARARRQIKAGRSSQTTLG